MDKYHSVQSYAVEYPQTTQLHYICKYIWTEENGYCDKPQLLVSNK